MTRWTYDPVARVWPRVWFMSSNDLKTWSDPVWAEPWGIDPELFRDPVSNKTYLNLMAPNNNKDRLWGLSQCEVSLSSGNCVGPYVSLWNGTLPHNNTARPEGPKMYHKDGWYYLLIAEGKFCCPSHRISFVNIPQAAQISSTDQLSQGASPRLVPSLAAHTTLSCSMGNGALPI